MPNKHFFDQGIVLKRSNFGEADRILTVFTHEYGKFSCVAKGVRKITSKKGPHIELFTHSNLYFVKTSSLPIITQATTINAFPNLKKNLETTRIAFSGLELLDRLLVDDHPQPNIFRDFLKLLTYLDTGNELLEAKQSLLVSRFQLKILDELGFGKPNGEDPLTVNDFIETIIDRRLLALKTLI